MDLIENMNLKKSIRRHPWELARLGIISSTVNTLLINTTSKNVAIIDIGCGDGFIIENLSRKFEFSQISAIDINFTAGQISKLKKENKHIEYFNTIELVNINSNYLYIILLNDVIEHVEKHNEFLEFIDETIIKKTQQSFLFITVPAFNYLFSQHDFDLGHYRRYKISDLIEYNNLLKLNIEKSGYFFFLLYLVRIIERKINKNKKSGIGVSSWNHNLIFTKSIQFLLNIDYNLGSLLKKIRINLPGLSAYIIFSKNEK